MLEFVNFTASSKRKQWTSKLPNAPYTNFAIFKICSGNAQVWKYLQANKKRMPLHIFSFQLLEGALELRYSFTAVLSASLASFASSRTSTLVSERAFTNLSANLRSSVAVPIVVGSWGRECFYYNYYIILYYIILYYIILYYIILYYIILYYIILYYIILYYIILCVSQAIDWFLY